MPKDSYATVPEADVIVVGAGSAGLAAAITAHDAGSSVVVVEKAPEEYAGGNSRVSGQLLFSPSDVAAARIHLQAMSREFPTEESVVAAWAEETSRNHDWAQARIDEVRGVVRRDHGDPLPVHSGDVVVIEYGQFRAHTKQDAGASARPKDEFWEIAGTDCGTEAHIIGGTQGYSRLWLTLLANVEERGITVRYATPVVSLIRNAVGEVDAVAVEHDGNRAEIRARQGVVLATGGFAANPQMTRNYLRLADATPWGSPYNTGDGIRIARRLGSDITHPYNYMAMMGVRTERGHGEWIEVRNDHYVQVGADGRRFINEKTDSRHGEAALRGTYDFYPGHDMWTIFDENGRLAGPMALPREHFPVGWMKQVLGYEWSSDNSVEIEKGWITKANSLRELADKLGIDPDGLEAEITLYNDGAQRGEDARFGRPAETLAPLQRGPFYGFRWAQLLITTLGGLRKDGDARVIDACGEPIPRLYAAGDTASTYTWLISGGMGLGDAIAFGRIAGRNVAKLPHRQTAGSVPTER